MASKLASGDLIADRYASALYDLAADSKSVDLVLADLTLLQTMLNDQKDLHLLIKSPLIASTDKLNILESEKSRFMLHILCGTKPEKSL